MTKASSAAVTADTAASKNTAEKTHERVVEKRRALGRGLDSLLPSLQSAKTARPGDSGLGPRVVIPAGTDSTLQAVEGVKSASAPASSAVPVEGIEQNAPTHRKERDERDTRIIPTSAEGAGEVFPAPIRTTAETIADLRAEEDAEAPAELRSAGQPRATVPTPADPLVGSDEVLRLPIDLIDDNPYQTRTAFGEQHLDELAQSIRTQGVLQPIAVRPAANGRYTLILGERRVRASRMAGLDTIPAVVKRVNEQQAAEMTLVENLQRKDLDCLEQADAFAKLSKNFHLTQEEIGKRVGMSRETVSNYMRLLSLPENVLSALITNKLTFSHARTLMQLTDHAQIWGLAKRAIEERLSVAELDDLAKGLSVPHRYPKGPTLGSARWVDPNVKAAQRSLEEVLGMRVRIRDRDGRGRIVIEYSTIDDFDRVVEMLGGK